MKKPLLYLLVLLLVILNRIACAEDWINISGIDSNVNVKYKIDNEGTLHFAKVDSSKEAVLNRNGSVPAYIIRTINGVNYNNYSSIIKVVADEPIKVTGDGASMMFSNLSNLTSVDLTNFDFSTANDATRMFYDCDKLTEIKGLSGKNFSNVKSTVWMFGCCESLKELDLSNTDFSSLESVADWFRGSGLESINLNGMKCESLKNLGAFFYGCPSLTEVDISVLDFSDITNMDSMFAYSTSLKTIKGIEDLVTDHVTNMSYMFEGCTSLTTLDLSKWDTSNVVDMSYMFDMSDYAGSDLTDLNLSGWNTSNVTNMDCMFIGCTNLEKVDLSSFNTSNVTSMILMFENCRKLRRLYLPGFDTRSVTSVTTYGGYDLAQMFYNCYELEELYIPNFDTSNLSVYQLFGAFANDGKLKKITLGSNFSFGQQESYFRVSCNPPTNDTYTGKWVYIEKASSVTDNSYPVGSTLTASRLQSLYDGSKMAGTWVWEKNQYTITYHPNGGEGTIEPISVSRLDPTFTTSNGTGFTYDNRPFQYWNTLANNTGNQYEPNKEYTISSDLDLYAQWAIPVAVNKIWNDNDDVTRPPLLNTQLIIDETPVTPIGATSSTITLPVDGDWSTTVYLPVEVDFSNLQAAEDNVAGYTQTDKRIVYNADGSISVTFINKQDSDLVTTSFTVKVTWQGVDKGNIVLQLYADGVPVSADFSRTSTPATYTASDLPKYNVDGSEIIYSATETHLPGYLTVYLNVSPYSGYSDAVYNNGTIVNKEIAEFRIKKKWIGLEGKASFQLYQDGEPIEWNDIEKSGDWYIWNNLPKLKDGKYVIYTVKEKNLSNYHAIYPEGRDYAKTGETIVNYWFPPTGDSSHLIVLVLIASIAGLIFFRKR